MKKKVNRLLVLYLMIILGGITLASLAQQLDIIDENSTSLYDYKIEFTPSTQNNYIRGSVGGAMDAALVKALDFDVTAPGDTKYSYFLTPVQNASDTPIMKDVGADIPQNTTLPDLQASTAPQKLPIKKSDPEPTVTKNTSISSSHVNKEKHYLYPQPSSRVLSNSELEGLSREQLKMMRNEIYARHSYIFTSEKLRNYFEGQAWYTPLHRDVSDMLTPIEKDNIILIKQLEKREKTGSLVEN